MRTVIRYLPLLTITACRPSQQERADQTFESLIRAERAFAETSRASGTRDAFLEFLAPDAVVFDAGPVNGRSVWQERSAGPAILFWTPEIVDVSDAGDMGYTSGPWEVRATLGAEPNGWGHFVSVWTRDTAGIWSVAADGGIVHGPVPVTENATVERVEYGANTSLQDARLDAAANEALAETDAEYSRSIAEGRLNGSIDEFVSLSARFYRNGNLPLVGRETAFASGLVVTGARWKEWEARGAVVSQSGDLGFTYGVVEFTPDGAATEQPRNASYYRIWKRDSESPWRVVVDVLIPFAPT